MSLSQDVFCLGLVVFGQPHTQPPTSATASTPWIAYVQAIGIVGGLFFTGYNLLLSRKAQHVANILLLATGYRDVWKSAFTNPELHRVLSSTIDLQTAPVTDKERLFMKMLILHAFNAFLATRAQVMFPLEGLRADIQDLLSLPIPHEVWLEIRPYQNQIFISFVENDSPDGESPVLSTAIGEILHSVGTVWRWFVGAVTSKGSKWIRSSDPTSLRLFPTDKGSKP